MMSVEVDSDELFLTDHEIIRAREIAFDSNVSRAVHDDAYQLFLVAMDAPVACLESAKRALRRIREGQ